MGDFVFYHQILKIENILGGGAPKGRGDENRKSRITPSIFVRFYSGLSQKMCFNDAQKTLGTEF